MKDVRQHNKQQRNNKSNGPTPKTTCFLALGFNLYICTRYKKNSKSYEHFIHFSKCHFCNECYMKLVQYNLYNIIMSPLIIR